MDNAPRRATVPAPDRTTLQNEANSKHSTAPGPSKYFRVSVPTRDSEALALGRAPLVGDAARRTADIEDHLWSLGQLAETYKTGLDTAAPEASTGLTRQDAEQRLKENGPNTLSPPETVHPVKAFMKLLAEPFTIMPLIAAVVSLVAQVGSTDDLTPTYLGIVLIVVVFLNTTISFVQERKSAAVLRGFTSLLPTQVTVVRNGTREVIDGTGLVPGEVVFLNAGDKVPADIRLIHCTHMTVDNSSLTGENEPQKRAPTTKAQNPLEADNLAFFGTTVLDGSGLGVVIRRGDQTVMGQIASLAGTKTEGKSPLAEEIGLFVNLIGAISLALALAFFVAGMVVDPDFSTNLIYMVGIFVALVPQSLPTTVTILLTFAAQSLVKQNVLVKDLHAVDTLGAITLLASDKTGTLTQNRMTVVSCWTSLVARQASPQGTGEVHQFDPKEAKTGAEEMLDCLVLCSTAAWEKADGNMDKDVPDRKVLGDATEAGILRFTAAFLDPEEYRASHKKVFEVPFSSEWKWALTICEQPHESGDLTLYLKGAPERVMGMCDSALVEGEEVSVRGEGEARFNEQYNEAYRRMAGRGERVLACASWRVPRAQYPPGYMFDKEAGNYPREGYTFLGLVGLQDPPKPGVPEAVASCHSAGIQVMMVTGDHPLTAEAIARQVGIIEGRTKEEVAHQLQIPVDEVPTEAYEAVVVHGDEMIHLSEEDWTVILSKKEVVFSRTSPKQKLEIVVRCQGAGHVVGMTGDGVNDSPALRRADMGVSMALTGSDVSREAAAIVLLDDNFASIVAGIKQGRTIFVNLKKSITYTCTHSIAEVIPFLLYIVLGLPLGMNSFLVLFVDFAADLLPALAFAYEGPEPNIMNVPPRRHVEPHEVTAFASERRALEEVPSFQIEEMDINQPENEGRARALLSRVGARGRRFGHGVRKHFVYQANPNDEILVDRGVIIHAYAWVGVLETLVALAIYFAIFVYTYDIAAKDLLYAARRHFGRDHEEDFVSNGNVFSAGQQRHILRRVQSAWYMSIIVCQYFNAHLLQVTSRRPCTPLHFRNKAMYTAIPISVGIVFLVTHTPGVTTVLSSAPFPPYTLGLAVAGGLLILVTVGVTRRVTGMGKKKEKALTAQLEMRASQRASARQSGGGRGGAAVVDPDVC